MKGRGEDADGARSDYSYNTHNSQAPLSHGFPPTRGLAGSDNGPRPSASYNVNFNEPSVRSTSQSSPQTQQTGFNEKPSYSSFSRPTSPVNRHQHGRPSYGQLPGASQSDANLTFAEGDMGKVRPFTRYFFISVQLITALSMNCRMLCPLGGACTSARPRAF